MDSHKVRKVATFEVTGTYIHVEISKDKRILVNLRGDFVDIMCQVNPEYKQHVRYDNGKNVLYLLVIREFYGCIESSLF